MGIYVAIFAIVLAMAWAYRGIPQQEKPTEVKFSKLVTYLQKEEVKEIDLTETTITATLDNGKSIVAYAPSYYTIASLEQEYILPQIEDGIIYDGDPPKTTPWYMGMIRWIA